MKKFYETYNGADEKLSPLVRQFCWTNNLTIRWWLSINFACLIRLFSSRSCMKSLNKIQTILNHNHHRFETEGCDKARAASTVGQACDDMEETRRKTERTKN